MREPNQLKIEKGEVLKIWKEYYQEKFNETQNEPENMHEVCLSDNLEIRQELYYEA